MPSFPFTSCDIMSFEINFLWTLVPDGRIFRHLHGIQRHVVAIWDNVSPKTPTKL
jgi:hypothetical protein